VLASIRSCSRVYLFADALDECPEDHETRQGVLEQVKGLIHDAPNLKIFATSRELDKIRKKMEMLAFEPLPMVTCAVDADIRAYLSTQVSSDQNLCALGPEIRNLIESSIASQADGM
jgi:hypothetical protein